MPCTPIPYDAFAHAPSNTYITIEGKRIPMEALWDRHATSNTEDDGPEDDDLEDDSERKADAAGETQPVDSRPAIMDADGPYFDQAPEKHAVSTSCTCKFDRTCARCIRLAQSRHEDDAHPQCIREEMKKNDERFRRIGANLYPDYSPYIKLTAEAKLVRRTEEKGGQRSGPRGKDS
ncbi:unnamed protein product [Cyclocybe aegerita]|uniref:Uncharacterized protein n=1 Tax=Cyclocybe aegerita TaxID=1973307 RepID=A0A8S0W8E3_CYCAE|nr:unnamed protein product [Cyclocybe aegerita]